MVQMASYLDHYCISTRETFPDFFLKIRYDDVILSDFYVFDGFLMTSSSNMLMSAQNYEVMCNRTRFAARAYVRALILWVNHFQRISGSIIVGFLVFDGFLTDFDGF